ncbi:hypothetical protein, conserved [Eimeria acervulina]|uniref:Uncharacterized protein n=1 Tax=Eimeria acervulina TaxID=5801 RepID=U6GAV9_EIMAC|nr:hypothetical protein, conserved [Eimeria acervulina]CDI77270.1 hypothetical protein, conserved [Eimeria acervulina]
MRHLLQQAEIVLSAVMGGGPSTSAAAAAAAAAGAAAGRGGMHQQHGPYGGLGGGAAGDAILDPLQQQLLQLEQQQQQQLQEVMVQMQRTQQAERQKVEQKLIEARQQHIELQQQSSKIRSLLVSCEAGLAEVQRGIKELKKGETLIEQTTLTLEATLQRLVNSDGTGFDMGDLGIVDDKTYLDTKIMLGRQLQGVNGLLGKVAAGLEEAEAAATRLSLQGPSGRQVAEQLLQGCADIQLALRTQEEHLRDVVAALEAKQIACDKTMQELKTAIEAALAKYAEVLQQQVQQQQQQIMAAAEALLAAATADAERLKQQLDAEINKLVSGNVSTDLANEQLRVMQQAVAAWEAAVGHSVAAIDTLLDAAASAAASAAALPPPHVVDTSGLSQAVQQTHEVKKAIRKQRAELQQMLGVMSAQLREGQRQQQQQQMFQLQQQQQQQHQGLFSIQPIKQGPTSDPYSGYLLPSQVQQPQQPQQPQQHMPHQFMHPPQHLGRLLQHPTGFTQQQQYPAGFPQQQQHPAGFPQQQQQMQQRGSSHQPQQHPFTGGPTIDWGGVP